MTEPGRTNDEAGYGLAPAGFRMSPAARVGRVRLQVADLVRSVEFYRDVLGFHVDRDGGRLDLGAGSGESSLIELHEKPGVAPVPRRGRLGLYHFAILLPDRPSLGRFLAHLSELGVRPGASDHLVSEALYLQDPDGLGIEVYADRPRSEWQHRDGQLVMATDPLDMAGVVRAGEGRRWDGMPEGTRIGHVHLHVGDLERAEAFYHRALGLDKVVWSYPGALFLSAGGYHHHLGLNTWAAGAAPAGDGDARLLDWEIRVPSGADAEAALRSLETAGYPVERSGQAGVAADPWGTRLRIETGDPA